jgi:hypothetical protein
VKASFQREGYSFEINSQGAPVVSDPWGIRILLAAEDKRRP